MPHPSMQPCRPRRILPNIRSAALILLAGLCTGCPHPLWLPDRNLKTKVTEPEIIGRWDITSNSLALLKRDGFQPADHDRYAIHFRQDGTLAYETVLTGFHTATHHRITGQWALQHDTKSGANNPTKNALQLLLNTPQGTHSRALLLDKDADGLILWEFYGDPDSWEFIEYRKPHPPD